MRDFRNIKRIVIKIGSSSLVKKDFSVNEPILVKIIEQFSRLKEKGVYDNSIIIVLADHGYIEGRDDGRQNPILYIKGLNEHHKMITSPSLTSHLNQNNNYWKIYKKPKK